MSPFSVVFYFLPCEIEYQLQVLFLTPEAKLVTWIQHFLVKIC